MQVIITIDQNNIFVANPTKKSCEIFSLQHVYGTIQRRELYARMFF
jgi:hypothetical protein